MERFLRQGPKSPDLRIVQEAGHSAHHLSLDDLFIKDAFLVFRALCKLTMKPLNTERSVKLFSCFSRDTTDKR